MSTIETDRSMPRPWREVDFQRVRECCGNARDVLDSPFPGSYIAPESAASITFASPPCRNVMSSSPLSRRSFLTGVAGASLLGLPRGAPKRVVPTLSLPPFLARPTSSSILVSARNGQIDVTARMELKERGPARWRAVDPDRRVRAGDFMTWTADGLVAGTEYEYRLLLAEPGEEPAEAGRGRFTTQRVGETGFTAALSTDAHTGSFREDSMPVTVLDDVVRNVARESPDFMLALGDNVAWHTSRELPQEDTRGARFAYDMYRRHLAPLSHSCPHFGLIGNWEGESGKFPEGSVERVAAVRQRFTPNPDDRTYPQGGSSDEDYYAFDWGPVLFVVLNVQTYSEPSGELDSILDDVSRLEDWTLGGAQRSWLESVLERSDHPFKFVCIHHAVGGNAGNPFDTLYGRGGPRAASVGEQAVVHEMMREFGVQIFFYGHDHVFLDEVVDGIHYALPGSCGAPWKFGTEVTGYRRYWSDSGHARLTVRPDRATVEYIDRGGSPIHRFSVDPA